MDFWTSIGKALDLIEESKPQTFDALAEILREYGNPDDSDYGRRTANNVFFAGSGGDRQLRPSLVKAGWRIIASEAGYYYVALSPAGDLVRYTEGDVELVTWRPQGISDLVVRVSV